MNKYRLTLPWPPGNNHLFPVFRGRKIKSKKGREYSEKAGELILKNKWNFKLNGKLKISIEAYPPDRRVRDLDNLFKAPLDVLTKYNVISDDSNFDDIRMKRKEIIKHGKLEITISEIE